MRDDRLFDIDYINAKIYYYENIDRYRKLVRDYTKSRRKTDQNFKLMCNIRSRLNIALRKKNLRKDNHTIKLLGCEIDELVLHLQSRFTKGMTWENYGKWHIDHIVPLSSGKTTKEIERLCHFSNLQPLWSRDNIRKKNKL